MNLTKLINPPIYTGIGSRQSPKEILELIEKIARKLAKDGYLLRSGGAPGADTSFEKGCDKENGAKEIYLPWQGFNKNTSKLVHPMPEAFNLAQEIHPAWSKCSPAAKKLHARNIHQVLGPELNCPTQFILFWASVKDHNIQGGTATAVNLAKSLNIPTFNLLDKKIREKWEKRGILSKISNPNPNPNPNPPLSTNKIFL